MSTGHSPARRPNANADPSSHTASLDTLADRAEETLRDHLREEYDREPTEEEVAWTRGFPRRMAGGRQPEEPRTPTLTEMRDHLGWGPSESEKKRWGEDFAEQQEGGPDLSYR